MIIQDVRSLYFPHGNNIILIILAFIVPITIGLLAVYLLRKQQMTNRWKIILLATSFVFAGIILGGVPNVVLVIQQIFAELIYPTNVLLLVLRILIFLGLTFFFGRIFCGYVCPLGAAQELASMIRFKPKLDYNRTYKKRKDFLRWGFFVIYAIASIIWGLQATLFLNPINGFLIFWTPFNLMILIAFVIMIGTIILSIFIYRPYCRFFCPFGALASLFGRFSPLKIRRTVHCNDCGICEKICPTLEGFEFSNKGECYYCNRCIDFCTNQMFIDVTKIAQINRLLATYSLSFGTVSKEQFFDKIIRSVIRLLIPYKRTHAFEQFVDALNGRKEMPSEAIQRLVTRLRSNFQEEIEQLDTGKYKKWIEENKARWKENLEPVQLEKIFYGLAKKQQ